MQSRISYRLNRVREERKSTLKALGFMMASFLLDYSGMEARYFWQELSKPYGLRESRSSPGTLW